MPYADITATQPCFGGEKDLCSLQCAEEDMQLLKKRKKVLWSLPVDLVTPSYDTDEGIEEQFTASGEYRYLASCEALETWHDPLVPGVPRVKECVII